MQCDVDYLTLWLFDRLPSLLIAQEAENSAARKEKAIQKQREKLRRSELMATLREEFGSAPEEGASSGLGTKSGDLLKLQEEAREREDFEEDRFVRLVSPIATAMTLLPKLLPPPQPLMLLFLLLMLRVRLKLTGCYHSNCADYEREGQEEHEETTQAGLALG